MTVDVLILLLTLVQRQRLEEVAHEIKKKRKERKLTRKAWMINISFHFLEGLKMKMWKK